MSEAANATATGAAGVGLPGLMWGIDHTLWKPPEWLITLTIIVSVILLLVSLVLWMGLAVTAIRHWILSRQSRSSERSFAPKAEAQPNSSAQEGDIDASDAFNQILNGSEWQEEQSRNTRDTSHLVSNWLQVRLDTQIHKALVNG